MVAADHFVCDDLAQTQTYARKRLCTPERSLRFMEHTGLRPYRDYRKAYPDGSADEKLPDSDHVTSWVDPASGQFILIDEPYRGVPDEVKRTAWAAKTGWRVAKTSWPGMYYPHNCDLYLATDGRSGYNLDALAEKIEAIPAPLVEEDWYGSRHHRGTHSSARWRRHRKIFGAPAVVARSIPLPARRPFPTAMISVRGGGVPPGN
jgi:hypothetical protein